MDIVGTTSSSSVTLIIKAPNQSVSDQVIKCEMAWSIQNLKDHLTTVYPSKPVRYTQYIVLYYIILIIYIYIYILYNYYYQI